MNDIQYKNYLNFRKIGEHPSGFLIIKPADKQTVTPLFCPHCNFVMRNSDDDMAFKEFCCCDFCARNWASPNRALWKTGWRPDKSIVESKNRPPIAFEIK